MSIRPIEELQDVIRRLHGAEAMHIESVPVKDHPTAHGVYAWIDGLGDPKPERPRHHVTVLHLHPVKSAQDAIRAAIVQEF
jgi:hypothetical protein